MAESPLSRLIGTWEFEPLVEGRSAGTGRATFEWIEDGAFLVQRSDAEWTDPGWMENAPKANRAIIGFDDSTGEVVQLYADDRDVFHAGDFAAPAPRRPAPDHGAPWGSPPVGAPRYDAVPYNAGDVPARGRRPGPRRPDGSMEPEVVEPDLAAPPPPGRRRRRPPEDVPPPWWEQF